MTDSGGADSGMQQHTGAGTQKICAICKNSRMPGVDCKMMRGIYTFGLVGDSQCLHRNSPEKPYENSV